MVGGHFLCLTEEGLLLLLKVNPSRYEEVARMNLRPGKRGMPENRFWAAPVLSHGLLYVRGEDRLVCFELIPEKN